MTAQYPIIEHGDMVRAILDGRKTQTRRVVEPQPDVGLAKLNRCLADGGGILWAEPYNPDVEILCPYGQPGDLLWVRERWRTLDHLDNLSPTEITERCEERQKPVPVQFEVGVGNRGHPTPYPPGRWRQSIHMPKWVTSLWLRITGVRVERLQSITPEDCGAEGIEPERHLANWCVRLRPRFQELWDSLNADRGYGWDTNPWVWRVSFERAKAPA